MEVLEDSENAKGMMRNYHVGTLSEEGRRALRCAQDAEAAQPSPDRPVFLDPARWTQAVLRNKTQVSPDTKLFTFELDHEGQEVGLPVGQHLMLRLRDPAKPDEAIVRAYTPVSDSTHKGTLDVLIKLYLPPPPAPGVAPGGGGGRMTTALDQVPLGTRVDFKGPIGKFTYLGRGRVRLGDAAAAATPTRRVSSFVMICGGSGITPIFQVFRAIAQDAEDETSCTVLYGNRGVQDILLREELEGWARRKTTTTKSRIADQGVVAGGVVGGQCRVLYTLTNPPATGWDGRTGRISEELLRQEAMPHEDGGGGGAMALVCGPPAMEQSVREILLGLGWKRDDLVFF
ncbi:hypothetical protein VTK73DRAFT_7384 [Phialemonium thermophilum]|uniref:NADH-cytochrome b5 reductase n=1 Tax=Phialemonium thermophilum TaxID=223376 RepID=A0ABR3WEQ8_9PEZI